MSNIRKHIENIHFPGSRDFFLFQSQKRQIFHAMLVARVGKKGIVAQRAKCHIEGNTDRVVYRGRFGPK